MGVGVGVGLSHWLPAKVSEPSPLVEGCSGDSPSSNTGVLVLPESIFQQKCLDLESARNGHVIVSRC